MRASGRHSAGAGFRRRKRWTNGPGVAFDGARAAEQDDDVVILGLADGTERGAALVVDGRLVAAHASDSADTDLPWDEARAVLARAGLSETDVDLVAIAGRYTPPLTARRRPELRARAADPFATARLVGASTQRMLRATGFGAVDADRATEYFEARVRARGYRPRRVVLVDLHRCLAGAAYRCQEHDDALVLVLHPKGDGALASVHRGAAGQLDRIELDRACSGAHLWLDRCLAATGAPGPWALASAAAAPDPSLQTALAATLRVDGDGRWGATRIARRSTGPWDVLAHLGPPAVATVASVLRDRAVRWASAVQRRHQAAHLVLVGEWLRDPRAVAEIAALPGVTEVAVPWPDGAALAVGAAVETGGVAPEPPGRTLGAPVDPTSIRGVPADVDHLVRALAAGQSVARFVGHDPLTPHGSGARSVVVRADRAAEIERIRERLGRRGDEVPVLVGTPGALPVASSVEAAAGRGVAAARLPGTSPADAQGWSRVARPVDPALAEALRRLEPEVSAVAVFSLAPGAERPVRSAAAAIDLWQRAGLAELELGDQRLSSSEAR